jgi:hypothetical protein
LRVLGRLLDAVLSLPSTERAHYARHHTTCDACGEPATHRLTSDELCDECARERGAEMNGIATAAIEAMGHAIDQLRDSTLTDEQICHVVDGLLKTDLSEPDCVHDVIGYVLGRDWRVDRRWARMLTPISEAVSA